MKQTARKMTLLFITGLTFVAACTSTFSANEPEEDLSVISSNGLRKELIVSAPDPELVDQLRYLGEQAEDCFSGLNASHNSDTDHCSSVVKLIQDLTGNSDYNAEYFEALYRFSSVEEFAEKAALGQAPKVEDLRKAEIVDLINRAVEGKPPYSEYYLDLLDRSFGYAAVSDILYWPHKDMSEVEISEEILKRQSIFSQGGKRAVDAYMDNLAVEVLTDPDALPYSKAWAKGRIESRNSKPLN